MENIRISYYTGLELLGCTHKHYNEHHQHTPTGFIQNDANTASLKKCTCTRLIIEYNLIHQNLPKISVLLL